MKNLVATGFSLLLTLLSLNCVGQTQSVQEMDGSAFKDSLPDNVEELTSQIKVCLQRFQNTTDAQQLSVLKQIAVMTEKKLALIEVNGGSSPNDRDVARSDHYFTIELYATMLRNAGRLQESLEQYVVLEAIASKRFGEAAFETRDVHSNAADIQFVLKTSEPMQAEFVACLNRENQMDALQHEANYQSAIRISRENVAGFKAVFGVNHWRHADALNDLGMFQRIVGDYSKAEHAFLEAKSILENTIGKDHPYYADSMNGLGAIYCNVEQFAKAIPFLEDAIRIREITVGKKHHKYAMALHNLGVAHGQLGENRKAKENFVLALEVVQNNSGTQQMVAALHSAIAMILQEEGDFEGALAHYQESKAICESIFDQPHPTWAQTLNNLGNMYWKLGQAELADRNLRAAVEMYAKTVGTQHPQYQNAERNLIEFTRR